jgi:TetR/AcrR family tetracycline transcriptional repressor
MRIVPFRKGDRRKRKPLDQAQIVRAALALLDEVGLDELTMRRLAERLGVQAASLYRHVRNKDELLMLLGDEISGEIPFPNPSAGWRDQLIEAAWNVRRGLGAHRDGARVLASTAPFGPRRLRHIDNMLGILRAAGLSDRDAVRAAYHANNFVTEFAADEARFGSASRKQSADMRKMFKSLPQSDYPNIVALAEHLAFDDMDALFEFGIEMWLQGIRAFSRSKR